MRRNQIKLMSGVLFTGLLVIGSATIAAPPPNDLCSGAFTVPAAGPFPHLSTVVDVTDAGEAADPPFPSCSSTVSRSVWYSFKPVATSIYRISTCADTATTVADTVMGIYISSGGCAGPFEEVACSDDNCSSRSVVERVLMAGTTYYVVVWEYGEEPPVPGQTLVQLRISAPPPVFTTPSLLSGGQLQLNFSALAGQSYEVQRSTDLTNWFRLGDAQSVSTGMFQFTVTNLVAPARFFRVKSL